VRTASSARGILEGGVGRPFLCADVRGGRREGIGEESMDS